jgi:hypothetical protein
MLQDMGIDVFSSRQAVKDSKNQSASQPPMHSQPPGQSQPTGQTQARPVTTAEAGAQQPSPASAARAALAQSAPTPNQQTETMSGAGPNPSSIETVSGTNAAQVETGLTIELSFVATPSLVWVGDGPLSDLELRFLQDLAAALHQATTGARLKEPVRNSDFRWPIVEASGTPERAVTLFCEKHQMLSPNTAVIGSTKATETLKKWLGDNASHWLTVDALAQTAARGESKRALWQRLLEHLLAAK